MNIIDSNLGTFLIIVMMAFSVIGFGETVVGIWKVLCGCRSRKARIHDLAAQLSRLCEKHYSTDDVAVTVKTSNGTLTLKDTGLPRYEYLEPQCDDVDMNAALVRIDDLEEAVAALNASMATLTATTKSMADSMSVLIAHVNKGEVS